MYRWQIMWCILSVDYNQYNYCTLRTVCNPIFHSVQKKSGPNSCVILFMGLRPTTANEQPSLWKGAVEWGTVADASLSLAATLLYTAETCNSGTQVLLQLKNGTKVYTAEVVWRQQWFMGSEMCGWINRFLETNGLFTSATLQKKAPIFPKIVVPLD